MKVVIIEDEIAPLEHLKMVLADNGIVDIEVVAEIDSVEESIEFFKSERCSDVELLFMDIHLSDGYAFSIFKHVDISVPIIFTTAYDEYALKSFEVNCVDYILKPISKSDIERIFAKIKMISKYSGSLSSEKSSLETILVLDSWRTVPLATNNIYYFYKDGNKVKACNRDGKSFVTSFTLEKLEEQLDSDQFIRANRQFIVSRSSVSDIENYEGSRVVVNLKVATDEPIIISRTKVASFKRWISS